MIRITAIETELLRTHSAGDDFVTSYGSEPTIKNHVIVKVTADNGASGVGEACPLPDFSGEPADLIKLMIDKYYTPLLLEKNPFDLETIHRAMDFHYPANNSAKAAIDIALYDLIGKTLEIPVYQLLGGCYRQEVELGTCLGIGEPSVIAERAEHFVKQGTKAIKLKVGVDPKQDLATVKAVRKTLGDAVKIRIDANGGYSLKTAMKVLRELEAWDIQYAEQPIADWNHEGLKLLRQSTTIPIMVDESLCTIEDAVALIRREAVDLFGIKLIKHGGIYKTKKILTLAEAYGIDCVVISPWETQIAVSAGIHLAVATPNCIGPHDLGTKELKDDPTEGLKEEKGVIRAPTTPGLGVSYTR
ncbi:MAG: mandelate racemase/muconate lactonizing enzyme family protein [Candidatus Thorarchaeota archaeon]